MHHALRNIIYVESCISQERESGKTSHQIEVNRRSYWCLQYSEFVNVVVVFLVVMPPFIHSTPTKQMRKVTLMFVRVIGCGT